MPPRTIQKVLGIDPEYTRPVDPERTGQAAPVEVRPSPSSRPRRAPAAPPAAPPASEVAPVAASAMAAAVEPSPSVASAPDGPTPQVPARSRRRFAADGPRMERVAVWVRPLREQVGRIAATGLPPDQVLKAAWRKAAPRCALAPSYVAPSPAARAEGDEHRYASSLRLDADTLAALARARDPLGVMSRWALVRGQVEPLFWAALDELLAHVEQAGAAGRGRGAP